MIPSGPIPVFKRGQALHSGDALNKLAQMLGDTQNNITAFAGGAKLGATPITSPKAQIATVANVADSVLLPPGYPGLQISIFNSAANSAQVFGAGNDTINGIATGTGVAHAGGKSALYTCYNVVAGVGQWGRNLSA